MASIQVLTLRSCAKGAYVPTEFFSFPVRCSTTSSNTSIGGESFGARCCQGESSTLYQGCRGIARPADPEADAKARIDVNEQIFALEHLNPTPRPTTSSLFDGSCEFHFAGATSPGLIAA
ncbi:hypothetical protein R1flu_020293 [Riccia fluitans]|uniref:Uncharacterized protein n=1 Tax=Riccia fluitans TaxID=41844 RepID=A0ABD1ZLH1_9MARC